MEDAALRDALLEKFNEVETAPFLFVGSGLSRRYIGLDDWEGTLRHFAKLTDRDYEYYAAQAGNDLPTVASLIAEEFYELWWQNDEYAEQRADLKAKCTTKSSPLKFQIAEYMRELADPSSVPDQYEEEVDALRRVTVDGIITTNWDTFLEKLFPEYTVYASQDEVLFSYQHAVAEIYKIHGCCQQPNSLVLTAADYEDFNRKNAYLAAKLTTVFLEHPIVFLGYSLQDANVQSILNSLGYCLSDERLETLSDRLIFVQRAKGKESSISPSVITAGDQNLEALRVTTDSFASVYEALAQTERRINANLLRQVKKQVYELVQTNDPQDRMHVVDIENLEDHEDVEIVVGVGVYGKLGERGLTGIEIDELFEDLVSGGHKFDDLAEGIVMQTIRGWLDARKRYVPLYKYLKLAGMLTEDGYLLDEEELPPRIVRIATLPRSTYEYDVSEEQQRRFRTMTIADVEEETDGPVAAARYITLVENIDVDNLEDFLSRNSEHLTTTEFRKLACMYDRLRYGPGFDE
ncbi:SIR2 family protein [Salinibacter ruber]|jgi:hypothetical protein|uniref:SIR2 family protein n=1 Tax=Salinibacter ruber TaxID=146919 RepID=UPI000DD5E7AE|nr:SIR2 family protein [Salinibacter ruber]MCS3753673.1 hypothetical protein [Salinibacter ruber]